MPTYRPEIFVPKLPPPGSTVRSGLTVPLVAYWPVNAAPGFGPPRDCPRPPGYGVNLDVGGPTGAESVCERDLIYNAILADPLDVNPRLQLADCLIEAGADAVGWPKVIADFPGGLFHRFPGPAEFYRWNGPGLLADSPYGLAFCWAGTSGQFMQACREGLFVNYPITCCIVWNLRPLSHYETGWVRWFYLFPTESYQTQWLLDWRRANPEAGPTGWTMTDLQDSVIGPAASVFCPSMLADWKGHGEPLVAQYFTTSDALFDVSAAFVNLGRHVVGLDPIRFPLPSAAPAAYTFGLWHHADQMGGIAMGRREDGYENGRPLHRRPSGREFVRMVHSGRLTTAWRHDGPPAGTADAKPLT